MIFQRFMNFKKEKKMKNKDKNCLRKKTQRKRPNKTKTDSEGAFDAQQARKKEKKVSINIMYAFLVG